jgi:hypothetical protein
MGARRIKPDYQVRYRPIARYIKRDHRGAKDLDRRIEWRRLENQGAHVIFLLVACLIAPTTEWNPLA